MNRTIAAIMRHMGPPEPQLSWSKPASLSPNGSNGSDKHLEGEARTTKNVLFLQSSPLGADSYSQRIADSVLNELKAQYQRTKFVLRDLSETPPPHINRQFITASSQLEQQTPDQRTTLALSDALIDELVNAEIIVIAVPVYNFAIPSTLKAWIDHVVRMGRTFSETSRGPKGLLQGKRAILILAGGDLHSESSGSLQDLREPYLRAVLGFIGITEVEIVRVARPGALGSVELDRAGDRTADVLIPEESSDRKESWMKTKVMIAAVMVMAAMISHAEAGPHAGGGFGGAWAGGGVARPSMHAAPRQGIGGRPALYSGQQFSSAPIRPHYTGNAGGFRSREINRSNIGDPTRAGRTSIAATQRRQAPNGNNLRPNWRDHVFARHGAGWHHDWDRNREHWWHGHRCRFVDGSWIVLDVGFDPWWPYWWDYPYYYDTGDYSDEYYEQNSYTERSSNSLVAAVQQELAREGYYRSQIDGMIGPDTGRAINHYQSDHGLRTTGTLTAETLYSLGVDRPARS